MKKFLIVLIILFLLIIPVTAKQTLNSSLNITDIKDTSITWSYVYLTDNRPIGATFDGIDIEGFKTDLVYNYTANNLQPNTFHEFCLYGEITSNCEGTFTTLTLSNAEKIDLFIYTYIWLIFSIILIVIGLRIPLSCIIGVITSLFGLYNVLPLGNFMIDMIYVCLTCAACLTFYYSYYN